MKRNIIIFLCMVVVVAALLIAGVVRRHNSEGNSLGANINGQPAPEFMLDTLDGKKLKLSDLRGKAVLLNFWATWCAPCTTEMPWFVELQNRYAVQGLQVVGINMDDGDKNEVIKFANKIGVNYPILMGKDTVANQYGGVQFLPTTFYIDRNGKIVERVFGIASRKEIEDNVRRTLAVQSGSLAPANTIPNSVVPNRGSIQGTSK